jgi:hypothetical protein
MSWCGRWEFLGKIVVEIGVVGAEKHLPDVVIVACMVYDVPALSQHWDAYVQWLSLQLLSHRA